LSITISSRICLPKVFQALRYIDFKGPSYDCVLHLQSSKNLQFNSLYICTYVHMYILAKRVFPKRSRILDVEHCRQQQQQWSCKWVPRGSHWRTRSRSRRCLVRLPLPVSGPSLILLCNHVRRRNSDVSWGRCYDHYFCRFSPIFGKKLRFSNQCYYPNFAKTSSILLKKRRFFGAKIFF
jgi:hypothetical protein